MKIKALALFSGGLDSIIAVKVIQDQGIQVLGITFETPFFSSVRARGAAGRIGLDLEVRDITEEHLEMLKHPRYGYGRNMNPCIDCHSLMLRKTGEMMEDRGASFIITGEVLGQRPMSQTKQSLHIVAKNSGFADIILRPLSARLLPETKPEREGWIDRSRLLAISGRNRKIQMNLANQYGIGEYDPPAGGCLLTDPMFSKRLRHLLSTHVRPLRRDLELLKHGRHFSVAGVGKIIVGRNSSDNKAILNLSRNGDDILRLWGIPGPVVIIPGGGTEETRRIAASLCALYGGIEPDEEIVVIRERKGKEDRLKTKPLSRDDAAKMII